MKDLNDALGLPSVEIKTGNLINNEPPSELGQNMADTDYDYARTNMRDAIGIAMQALQDAAIVASQSQQANAFVSVAQIAKSVTDASKTLLELSKTHKELKGEISSGPVVTNQNLYVGTTSEFIKMLKQKEEESKHE